MQLELGKTFRTDSTPVQPRETDLSENSPDFSLTHFIHLCAWSSRKILKEQPPFTQLYLKEQQQSKK